jgi:hypothetical protein
MTSAEHLLRPEAAPVFPAGRSSATELASLPSLSTYAWVDPSALFEYVLPLQDSLSRAGAFREQRGVATAVLNANGWLETSPDSASYHLALVDVTYSGVRTEMRPDPRSLRQPPLYCPTLSRERQQVCTEPPPPRYPEIATSVSFTDRRITFGVRRVHDGAMRAWRVTPESLRKAIPHELVVLLTTNNPSRP